MTEILSMIGETDSTIKESIESAKRKWEKDLTTSFFLLPSRTTSEWFHEVLSEDRESRMDYTWCDARNEDISNRASPLIFFEPLKNLNCLLVAVGEELHVFDRKLRKLNGKEVEK